MYRWQVREMSGNFAERSQIPLTEAGFRRRRSSGVGPGEPKLINREAIQQPRAARLHQLHLAAAGRLRELNSTTSCRHPACPRVRAGPLPMLLLV